MRRVRIGVVGLGFGQFVHVPAFRLDPRAEVYGICGNHAEKAKKVAQELGVPKAYATWQELVADSSIDVIAIAVPPESQPEIIAAAIENKKHLFCEKPIGGSANQAVDLVEAARKQRLVTSVDFEFAYLKPWQEGLKVIKSGRVGKISHAQVTWNVEIYAVQKKIKDSWKVSQDAGGGPLNAFCSHVFHYLELFLGRTEKLWASIDQDGLRVENSFKYANGVRASSLVTNHSFQGTGHRFEIYGENGCVVLENSAKDYIKGFQMRASFRDGSPDVLVRYEDKPEGASDGRVAAVGSLVSVFLDRILGLEVSGELKWPTLDDGARVQRLMELSRESSLSGQWVGASN